MTVSAETANLGAAREPLLDPGGAARVKVCGIVEPPELDVLGAEAVDFVGLWWGVPGGPHDLPAGRWRELAGAAESRGLTPVLVTFSKDAAALAETLAGSGVRWVQLHGYPTPGTVKKVKAIADGVRVIKVLHVRGGECVEASLIGAYERAGVDVFLFDTVSEDGQVGSTGLTLDAGAVLPLLESMSRPFLIAGGISEDNRHAFAALVSHPLFLGIDVDTNARGEDRRISDDRVGAITRAWRPSDA